MATRGCLPAVGGSAAAEAAAELRFEWIITLVQGPCPGNCDAGAKVIGGVWPRRALYFVSWVTPTILYTVAGGSGPGLVNRGFSIGVGPDKYSRMKCSFPRPTLCYRAGASRV